MKSNKIVSLAVTTLALGMCLLADANAAGVDVKCEVRNGRSKVSVDGSGLSGDYTATVTSNGISVSSESQTADPVTREVEFDFDSNRADIRAGATEIARDFLSSGQVIGSITAVGGASPVASAGATCRRK